MNEYESRLFDAIIEELSGSYGTFDIDVQDGNVSIEVKGDYKREYTRDTDYYSGTGGYTTTYAELNIKKCNVHEYTEDGEEIHQSCIEIDIDNVRSYIEDYMYNY